MSKILKAVYRAIKDLHAIGGISDERMKEFEELCAPDPKKPKTKRVKSEKTKSAKRPDSRKPK